MIRHSFIAGTSLSLIIALGLSACSKSTDPISASAPQTPTAAVDNKNISPDLSDRNCSDIPEDQVENYKRLHDVFTQTDALQPEFNKGDLFTDGSVIRFKRDPAQTQMLTVSIDVLRRCDVITADAYRPLEETVAGSGELSASINTVLPGSRYPAGTPGVARVEYTVVDRSTMRGTTTLVGEYSIRLQGPSD